MKRHKHKAISDKRRTIGFSSCVSPENCNAKAHGGVTHIDACSCGATRKTNSTGFGREERGKWEQSA